MTQPAHSDDVVDLFDVVAVSPSGAGEDSVALELTASEAAALAALAQRTGVAPNAIWRATWALLVARLAGVTEVRIGRAVIAVPREGEVASWLALAAAAKVTASDDAQSAWTDDPQDPSEDGAAVVWRAIANGTSVATARFARSRIDRANMERLAELLHATLAAVVAPAARLETITPLSAAERTLVVETWNATRVEYRAEATVHALFREQAAAHPDRVAIAWDGGALGYGELDRWSDALAERLIAAGVAADQPVALVMERCPEAIVAALAILKAGGAYLPLDPDYPADRLAFAIGDAGADVLLTTHARGAALAAFAQRTLFVEDARGDSASVLPRIERATPQTRAYVMYTSGSTGTPKGVQIEHRSIVRLVGRPSYVELAEHTRFLHAAPLGFDASTLELWGPLLHGGSVVVYRDPVPTGRGLARAIAAHGVTTMWLTAALFNSVVDEDPRLLSGLRQLFTGGEALSPAHVKKALAALPQTELVNGYGPTECTTFTTTHSIPRDFPAEVAIPIGRPIADTQCYVLDRAGSPVPVGIVGELFVGGLGVARGYLARPELDRERFVANRYGEGRLYRTGDRVRWRPDGTIDFLGRADNQVKLRGFRIELGEIEARLGALPGVQACAVLVRSEGPLGKRLVAYVVPSDPALAAPPVLRTQLAKVLPEFMIPATFVTLSALPVTANGKLDRAKLPAPTTARPELAQPYRAPTGDREATICRVFAATLGIDQVGALDGFFELGGNSLLSVRLLGKLREAGLPEISPAIFFAAPTPAALAKALDAPTPIATRARAARSDEPIAIIGFAGRFPGANDVAAFWDNLCAGKESITTFGLNELDPSIPAAHKTDPAYVPARGVLDGVELFDHQFFGISPLEAQLLDPQHRHFLEVAWHALEHAGHVPDSAPGPIGIFGGMYNATYFQRHLVPRPDVSGRLGELALMLGNEKDYVTTRVAHKLGLTGPAVAIHTACSTSLVAAAMAMDSLRNGACDIALAGGVAITCPPASGHLYQDGSMASPDGKTRTFDAQAGGTVFSDGVAMVVLRRLSDAIASGDQIYAVMLGAAVNNDGSERASFTAPSPEGQAAVIAAAHDAAGIDARTLSYVEAHGTATPLGDPIEIEGLTRAFSRHTQERGFCAIGSVKSNVGHLVIAAGATSLIKTSLALHHKLIPPSINFTAPTPKIDFARTPFRVQTELAKWPASVGPRRAGVSSFGFGGTNAHAVLEEAPPAVRSTPSPRGSEVLLVSARTPAALEQASTNLARYLEKTSAPLADVAHTLQTGRKGFDHRRWVAASSVAEAARLLTVTPPDPARTGTRELGAELPALGFLCPGQGSQYARMGYGLYHSEPAFRAAYDECCAILEAHTGGDPREVFFSEDPKALVPTSQTQPAIFTLEYSLAKMWMSWGVEPTMLIGHSVGEWVCAALAEIMPLGDALGLVVERGRRMQELPAGTMLSVRLPAKELEPKLPAGVAIAAENAPGLCVASGPTKLIAQLEAELVAGNVAAKRLVTSHAFHSSMMDPVIEPLAAKIAAVKLSPPKLKIMSTVTATWMTDADATSVRYWAEHLRAPVRFAPAVAALLAESRRVLIEIGPRATLTALARQATGKRALPPAVASLADTAEKEPEAIAAALGQLWALGASFDWAGYRSTERRKKLALPAYPFQRVRHWVDAPASVVAAPLATPAHLPAALPGFPALPVPVPEIPAMSNVDRRPRLVSSICQLVEEVSGLEVTEAEANTPWLELGLDSLTLTQLALQVQRTHAVKVTFRQVMESFPTMATLAQMLDEQLPAETAPAPAPAAPAAVAASAPIAMPAFALPTAPAASGDYVRQVIDQQMMLMQAQLALLAGGAVARPAIAAPQPAPVAKPLPAAAKPAPVAPAKNEDEPAAVAQTYDVKKAFGAIARIHTAVDELTPQQRSRLDALIQRYTKRTRKSKDYTIEHREHMADPRVVNGFRPLTKELTYQIVIERSRGSKLWDLDGNEYVDVLQGFGMSLFGWQPDFLRKAIHEQVDLGYEIGPQHVLAGETAKLFCEVTGAERAAFCNTGSEAVMGAMRIARTITGRTTIAVFTGAYHGIFDEVIVRGTRKLKSIPAAPGIMPSTVQNVLVLDYGTPESLEILRERADELAAIVVEPVQSRRPDFAPVEFLRELRKLTEDHGILFVFDEVVCGFRAHPRGAQGLFGIQADLASYGKVVGGGFSIGVIAGKRQFMDALDGGQWRYGDESIPTVGVTYFAGTFVRHPLALAASKAVLEHIKEAGPSLQENLTAKTAAMVAEINAYMQEIGAPFKLNTFASLWRNVFTEDLPYGDLIYAMIRDRGIHILDNFPCFLTTSHSDEDLAKIVRAYKEAASEMQASGFFPIRVTRTAPTEAGVREAPSTEPQREVWLADKLGTEASLAYNESVSLHLRGELDVGALRQAVRDLPLRHDALRATFSSDGTAIRAASALELEVPLRDLSDLPTAEREQQLAAIVARHVGEPFALEQGPLIRAELVRLDPDHHVLVFTGHHIVLDGWSYWVIVKDLASLYGIATGARTQPLAPAPSFFDYAIDIAGKPASANEAWWVERFATGVPTLDLPTDRPRPAVRTTAAGREDYTLPADLLTGVKKLGAKLGASAFATLLAGFDVLLHRITGATDIVVGVPAAGQASAGLEGLVGHAVNMLPLRNQLQRTDTFAEHVTASRKTMLDAYDHQDVTFGRVLQMLPIARDPSRLPLITVIFNIDQALAAEGHGMPGISLELALNARIHETFELFINAVDTGNGLRIECQYNKDLFDAATVRRWLAAFEVLLRAAITDPTTPLGKLPLVPDEDRRLLAAWNRTEADYPRTTRVEELMFATARRVPERIAVTAKGKTLTYRALAQRAEAIAGEIRATGVRAGDRVGLLVDRDLDLVPSLFGALAAGATYVPLDPSFPTERLRFMVEDAKVAAIVTTSAIAQASASVIGRVPVVILEDAPATYDGEHHPSTASAEDTAYVIYTSGSTGKPKGVRVPHRSVVNLLTSVAREPGMTERDVVLAVTTLSFDIATSELVLPLVVGAHVVIADRDEATDGDRLRALVEAAKVTFIDATPATWRLLLAAGWRGNAQLTAICTGEAMPRDLAAELRTKVAALWNGYGPTETTVWSSFQRIVDDGPISIGHPIANTTIHVLDADLEPVPVGVVGELFIGGDGVTQGYLDRPDLTAERFLPDPTRVSPQARVYRTGDLGRWRLQPDGTGALECLGRTDFQIKLRGYRIELGEIEAALARHPAIAQASVTTREDRPGDVRLVGYVVARDGAPSDEALRTHLAQTLPEYMIPGRFVALAALPLTPSGKVDRKALPAPSGPALANQGAAIAPRTPSEEVVAAAYMEALALPRLSVHDDFFALGGHSLLVAQMTSKLSRTLGRVVAMRAGFEHPTVASLAAFIDGAKVRSADAPPTIAHRAQDATAPLSLMQQRVWYLEQLQLGKTVFHVPSAHRLHGALDVAKLGRAFTQLVERQSILRTSIGTVGDAPAQIVAAHVDTALPFEDLSGTENPEAELAHRMEADIALPFDLARGPLWRVKLYKLGPDHHVLFFMPHHIIWDGWSFDLFYEEMTALYGGTDRPTPPVTYGDFAAWHRDWMSGPELARQLEHWKGKLAGAPDALDLPVDRQRPPMQTGEGATEWLKLPPATAAKLRAVGLQEGATLFMTLLGAWAALLHQLTRQSEIIVGTPVRGRALPEIEQIMGFFVNALPLRLRLDANATFLELIRQVRAETVEAFGAQDVPFEHLVRVLDLKRDESRFPIYQAFFSYQDARQRPPRWGDLEHHNVPVFQPSSAQDVGLWFLDGVDGVVGGLNYNTDILTADTAARWRNRYLALVEAIAAHPERPLRELFAVTLEERAQLTAWNATKRPLAADANLIGLFAALGARGDRPAIRHLGKTVTYAELAAERDKVAATLAARGVGPGDVVGLHVERTPFMLAALLGTLATGATYLPLDPSFPAPRLAFMLEDAHAKVVISDVTDGELPHAAILRPADLRAGAVPNVTAKPDAAAYLIYTSGSTGTPKGVEVPHHAVANFLAAMEQRPGLVESDRLVAVTTLSFDIAVLELMLPLTCGAEIVLATREQATDGNALRGLLEQHKATVMQATPATWRMLVEAGWRGGSSFKALCGGEALPPELAEALLSRTGQLWNMYGPTETTVWSTCARIEAGRGGVTIGTPIDNTEVWIVDDHGDLAPIGVPGELCIGGDGVALGYHGRAELTGERFIPDRYSGRTNARVYRTGDLARWRADGELVHLGRTDFQVKVRGYRIELGEIEVVLARHSALAGAVVVAQPGPGGEQRLVGYVIPKATNAVPSPAALREHLRKSLPDYMVPAVFVTLEAFPLTPNGKVDRRALPAPETTLVEPTTSYRSPRTHAEELVATVWRELLQVERISIADNFLDLGGHSLLIMQAIAKLEARTGKRISPRAFIFQTLEQIAREYDARPPDAPKPPPPPPTGRLQRWLTSLIPGSKS